MRTTHRALDARVLAVACERVEGTWAAYIGAVPGMNHYREWQEVLTNGAKLDERIARILFPIFAERPYAP